MNQQSPTRSSRQAISVFRSPLSPLRNGITLMEVLISMFVLLFGLMGVAAIFPVGNHYVVQAEKFDRGSDLANTAFEEIRARGFLAPERWVYAGNAVNGSTVNGAAHFIQQPTGVNPDGFNLPITTSAGPGHAFVIDPMSTAGAVSPNNLDLWPIFVGGSGSQIPRENDWFNLSGSVWENDSSVGERWPVRRMTLTSPNPGVAGESIPMPLSVAETTFRLRDDLKTALPERDDHPGILRWRFDGGGNPLVREYQGDFSWMATVVPLTLAGRNALQPSVRQTHPYEVSVAVFYKRFNTPTAETERLLDAEMLTGGELVMYDNAASTVDEKFKDIKAGDWVAVMGVNQTTGVFMLKWYRLLSLEEEAYQDALPSGNASNVYMRRAMVLGPDWHFPVDPGTGLPSSGVSDLRVAIFPGVASVVTREMELTKPANDAPILLSFISGGGNSGGAK